jgi:hypothetical protein
LRFESHSLRRILLVLACAALAGGAGCQSAYVKESVTAKLGGDDPDSQIAFWHELANRPLASNDDAFHALILFTDGDDPASTYAQRVQTLKTRKLLPPDFNAPADEAIQRGELAVAICKLLAIKGGLVMHLFGATPRYATRELVYDDLYPPSSPKQTFSGTEFVGVMGRIDDYQQAHPATQRGG